jgi:hypothetical protein
MHALERDYLRRLYLEACHGAGADLRWEARHLIQKWLNHNKVTLCEAFENVGLDMKNYLASRPISS